MLGTEPQLSKVLVDSAGTVYFPLSDVLNVTQIPNSRSATEWILEWPPPSFGTRLDLLTGEFERAGERQMIPESQRIHQPPDIFLTPAAIELLLGSRAVYSQSDLLLSLSTDGGFPITRRADLERRQRSRLGRPGAGGAGPAVAYPSASGGFAVNWGVSSIVQNNASAHSGRGTLAGAFLGGSYELGADLSRPFDDPVIRHSARYTRPFPEGRWLQQLVVGAASTPTPTPVFIDGVVLSNAPYLSSQYFQETVITPGLPAGWVAEVYEGEHLIGVAQSGGDGVTIPISYGFTPVRVRMIGPAGQELTEDIQYIVPQGRVPAGDLRYSLGGGRCRTPECNTYMFAELNRGLGSGVSAGAGLDRTAGDSVRETRPYFSIGLNPRPNASLDLRAAPGSFLNLITQYAGPRNTGVQLTASHHTRDLPGGSPGGEWRVNASSTLLLDGRYYTVRNSLSLAGGRPDRAQLFAGTQYGRMHVGAQLDHSGEQPGQLTLRAMSPVRSLPLNLSGSVVAVSGGLSRHGFESASTSLNSSIQRIASTSLMVSWRRGGAPLLTLTVHTRHGGVSTLSRVQAQQGTTSALISATGGAVLLPSRRSAALFPEGAVGMAGVEGVVFMDLDGDGKRGPGEPPVPDTPVISGGRRATSDSAGRYFIWGMNPIYPAAITVDTLRILDTQIAPTAAEFLVRPVPNMFTPVDIPVYRSIEVYGSIRSDEASRLGGIAIEIRDSTGSLVADSRTFSDGTFYFPRLPPGEFELSVAPASLAALGLGTAPAGLPVTVPHGRSEPIRLPPLELDPP